MSHPRALAADTARYVALTTVVVRLLLGNAPVVGVVGFVVHDKSVIDEVETVGASFVGVVDHFLNCKMNNSNLDSTLTPPLTNTTFGLLRTSW